MRDLPELLVDGQIYGGWTALRVTRGIERCAADFRLDVTDRWPAAVTPEVWQIAPGMACELRLGEDPVVVGWIDAFRPAYDATTHAITLSGRSKTGDFVDASALVEGGSLNGLTPAQVARRLAEPFGIEVDARIEGTVVREVQLQPGDRCFDVIERLCRMQEILVTDDASGRLVLCRAGRDRAASALVQGVNILAASADLDDARRHSEYVVRAQRAANAPGAGALDGGDDGGGGSGGESEALTGWRDARANAAPAASSRGMRAFTQIRGRAVDRGITRYRPLVLTAEGQADDAEAGRRADWEMRRRVARAVNARITVQGWRQADGRLWTVNEMVSVRSPWLALDRDLLISEVEFVLDGEGTRTTLVLTLPDAFLAEPQRAAARKTGGGGTGGAGGKWADVRTS